MMINILLLMAYIIVLVGARCSSAVLAMGS